MDMKSDLRFLNDKTLFAFFFRKTSLVQEKVSVERARWRVEEQRYRILDGRPSDECMDEVVAHSSGDTVLVAVVSRGTAS